MQLVFAFLTVALLFLVAIFAKQTGMPVGSFYILLAVMSFYATSSVIKQRKIAACHNKAIGHD